MSSQTSLTKVPKTRHLLYEETFVILSDLTFLNVQSRVSEILYASDPRVVGRYRCTVVDRTLHEVIVCP